jgi:TusE/DsrC/DsvC family sulfur relay protein
MSNAGNAVLKNIEFTNDGYMVDINAWTPEIGEAIADVLDFSLSEQHWEIISFTRDVYQKEEKNVSFRRITKDLGVPYQDIFDLFPGLPVRTIAKVAGLPKPVGCV